MNRTRSAAVGSIAFFVVRNPMYVGVAAAIAGQALSEKFGPPYDRYRRQVPGWWPRIRHHGGR